MHIAVIAILFLGSLTTCIALDSNLNIARFDNYRLYRITFESEQQVQIFQELEQQSDSCTFYGHARAPGQKLTIMVAAHKIADFADLLERFKVQHEILTYNFQASIDEQLKYVKPKDTPVSEFGWNHYFHLETINAWLDKIVSHHGDVLTQVTIGNSFEGRPIRGVKLSAQSGNTAIFVEGGIHAREWISPSTVTFILDQLLHSNDPRVKAMAMNFDWYIMPVVNPDGYAYTFEHDRMWRKSRKSNGLCRGADLNRNFNCHWNHTGSSPDPCRYDYAGTGPNSESEAAAITKFIEENRNSSRIETYISLHSFSQLMMFPLGHTSRKVPNYDDLLLIGQKACAALEQRYGTKYETGSVHDIIYPSSGDSMDWAYSQKSIPVAFTMELRGPPNSTNMFILPAEQITPTGWETLDAFVALLEEARNLGYYTDLK